MRIKTSINKGVLNIVDPPTWGAKLVGLIFLGAGAFILVLIGIDTVKKVNGGDISAISHSVGSVLIILVMTGVPGILFGFHTNRVDINRDSNQLVTIRDFLVYRYTHSQTYDQYITVKLKHRSDTSRSRIANSNQYKTRTRYYLDVILVDGSGKAQMIASVPENEVACACHVAGEVATYLQISFGNRDQYCEQG